MKRADRYFSPTSVLRKLHQERVVGLLYGQRALAIGAAHPLNYTATAIHSTGRRRPFARLARTARALEAIILGSRREADSMLANVNLIHATVAGQLPCDAGPYPAGTHYSAFAPDLMLWTLAVIADSTIYFFESLVRRLTPQEKEAAWQDYRRLGELFKLSNSDVPATYVEYRTWWEQRLASGELYLTLGARETGFRVAFEIPMPAYALAARREHNAILLGSLPPEIRALYRLAYSAEDAARFTSATDRLRKLHRRSPRWLAQGRNGLFFAWIARTERLRLERGQPTLQIADPAAEGGARKVPVG